MKNEATAYSKYLNRTKRMDSIDSFYWKDLFTIANIATLCFCLMDAAFMYTKWHAAYTESTIILILITAATAAVLDLPMMIAGKAIRKMQKNLLDKGAGILTVILSITAFLIAFGFSVWFAYTTKDMVFESIGSNMTITGAGAGAFVPAVDDTSVIVSAALFSAALPLGTSLASLVVTLFTYDPVKERLAKIRRARIMAEEHLRHINQGITEAETLGSRIDLIVADANAKYETMVENVWLLRDIRRQAYRQALMDISPDNDDINHIIDNAETLSFNEDFTTEPVRFISDIIEKEIPENTTSNPTESSSDAACHKSA